MKPIFLNTPWREQERLARVRRIKRLVCFLGHAAFWIGIGILLGRLAQ